MAYKIGIISDIDLSVSCMMAAVPAGSLPIPITLGMLTMLIVGLSTTDAIPVFVAAMVGFLVVQGLDLLKREHPVEKDQLMDESG